jgi:HK97 family phage major capsid protein
MSDVVEVAALEKAFKEQHEVVVKALEKANGQIAETGKVANEVKAEIKVLDEKSAKAFDRLGKMEAQMDGVADGQRKSQKTLGERFTESAEFKALVATGTGRIKVRYTGEEYKAIINATGQNQPLVPADRVPRIVIEPNRRLRIRDLIPSARTSSNLIEVPYEDTFTDNTGPQAGQSPTQFENTAKGESDATFRLESVPVTTYAHFIRASTQVLADAVQLSSYIDGRLRYFLKLKEETDLVTGDGASGRLRGLYRFASVFNKGTATGDTKLDTLRKAKLQLVENNYEPEAYVLNPADWENIEGQKDGNLRYVYGDPGRQLQNTIWGLPVVVTNSMPSGSFLCGAFTVASTLWDREDMSVSASTEDGDNFKNNMVTIRAEERLAHVIYLSRGLVRGDFSNSPIS